MIFSLKNFWKETPLIMRKTGWVLLTFFNSISAFSLVNILVDHDLKIYSHLALWSLLIGSILKILSDCLVLKSLIKIN